MGLRIALSSALGNADQPGKAPSPPGKAWVWHVLYILYSFEAGTFLMFFPWLRMWEDNYFLYRYPDFHFILNNHFLKGAILGLGIVNIIIGVQEFVRLRKGPRGFFAER